MDNIFFKPTKKEIEFLISINILHLSTEKTRVVELPISYRTLIHNYG